VRYVAKPDGHSALRRAIAEYMRNPTGKAIFLAYQRTIRQLKKADREVFAELESGHRITRSQKARHVLMNGL